jgi:hypothetical protein
MSTVATLPAVVAAFCLFVLPGFLLVLRLPVPEREKLSWDELAFLALSASVLGALWLGLVGAEAGVFSLLRCALHLPLSLAVALASGQTGPHAFWSIGFLVAAIGAVAAAVPSRSAGRSVPRSSRVRLGVAASALVLALALALFARPSEYILGGRDPGTYISAMALIGRTGGIIHRDPTVAAIPPEDVQLFYRRPDQPPWSRFMGVTLADLRSGLVYPEFFHAFPVFGAFLFQSMGVKGALATPAVFGVLGTWAFFLAMRRILGVWPALLAAVLLCLNVVQVWFARFPASEPMSQFLFFFALWLVWQWEQRHAPVWGALAGSALGFSLLVRIDSILIVAPLALYVLTRRLQGDLPWRRLAALVVPFALLAVHASVHAVFWASKYTFDIVNRPYWRQPWYVWALAPVALALVVATTHHLSALTTHLTPARVESFLRFWGVAVVAVAAYAYFLRPLLSAWAGADGNDPALAWAHREWLRTLGFRRLAAHDAQAFVRLGWFLSPLGLALAVGGFAVLLSRRRPGSLFFVLSAGIFSFFYLYKLRVWNDYFFAARRFVPVILPSALACAAFFLFVLGQKQRWRRLVAGGLALILAAFFLRATIPILRHVDWEGSVAFVKEIARHFGAEDVVIFEQKESVHLLSLPLWAVHGVNAIELARWDPDPERLAHLLREWRGRYRNIYFIYTYRAHKGLCGLYLERLGDFAFGTKEWQRSYDASPTHAVPQALRFSLARIVRPEELAVPALPDVDIGKSDDFQVSGFYDKEGSSELNYRWTGVCGSVYLPGAHPGDTLVLTASVGKRPAIPPAATQLSFAGGRLGAFTPDAEWRDFRFLLPADMKGATPVLRLQVPAFRPANVTPGSEDERELGIMVDRIRIEKRGPQDGGS